MARLRKLGRFWSPWPLSQEFGNPLYKLIGGAFVVTLFALAVVGVVRGKLAGGRRSFC